MAESRSVILHSWVTDNWEADASNAPTAQAQGEVRGSLGNHNRAQGAHFLKYLLKLYKKLHWYRLQTEWNVLGVSWCQHQSVLKTCVNFHAQSKLHPHKKNSALHLSLPQKNWSENRNLLLLRLLNRCNYVQIELYAWLYGSAKFTKLRIAMHKITWKRKFK